MALVQVVLARSEGAGDVDDAHHEGREHIGIPGYQVLAGVGCVVPIRGRVLAQSHCKNGVAPVHFHRGVRGGGVQVGRHKTQVLNPRRCVGAAPFDAHARRLTTGGTHQVRRIRIGEQPGEVTGARLVERRVRADVRVNLPQSLLELGFELLAAVPGLRFGGKRLGDAAQTHLELFGVPEALRSVGRAVDPVNDGVGKLECRHVGDTGHQVNGSAGGLGTADGGAGNGFALGIVGGQRRVLRPRRKDPYEHRAVVGSERRNPIFAAETGRRHVEAAGLGVSGWVAENGPRQPGRVLVEHAQDEL